MMPHRRWMFERRSSSGFTLLEVLLSLLLLGVLLAGVWQAMSLYEQVFTSGYTRIESVQVVRSIHEQLSSDLRGAIPDVPGELTGASTIRRFGLFGTETSLQIDLIEVVPSQFVFDTTTTTDPYSEALSEIGGNSSSSGLINDDSSTGGGFGLDSTSGLLDTQGTESIAKRVPELSTVRWQFFDWTDFEAGEGLTLLDLLAINAGLEPINTPTGDSEAFTTGFLVSDEATDSSDVLNGNGVSSSASSSANVGSISSSSSSSGSSGSSKSGGSTVGSSSSTSNTSKSGSGTSSDAALSTVSDSSGGGANTRFRYNQNFAAITQNGDAVLIGLVRRQIDWETPLDPASGSTDDSNTLSSSMSTTSSSGRSTSTTNSSDSMSSSSSFTTTGTTDMTGTTTDGLDETTLSDTLLGTESGTSDSGSSGMPTSALDQQRIRTIFHPDDPNVVWFPEVIGATFHYYDGESWTTQWNSLTKRSLPVAVAVQLQILPRKALSQKDLLKLRAAFLNGGGTSGTSLSGSTSSGSSSSGDGSDETLSDVDTLSTYGVLMDGMVIGTVDPDTGEYEMTSSSSNGTSGTTTGSGEISGSISSSNGGSSGGSSISQVSSGGVSGGSVSTSTSSTTGEISGVPIVRGAKYYQFFLPLPSTALAKTVTVSATPSADTEETEETEETEIQKLEIPTVALPTTESSGTTSSATTDSDQWMRTQ